LYPILNYYRAETLAEEKAVLEEEKATVVENLREATETQTTLQNQIKMLEQKARGSAHEASAAQKRGTSTTLKLY
jgi:uncharacterized protein Smg (DUF494 family)